VHAVHVSNLKVHTSQPLDVALAGGVTGTVPGDFEVAGEALRVVTPLDFQAVDD
jgi:diacylglycerol kinase family enzyme